MNHREIPVVITDKKDYPATHDDHTVLRWSTGVLSPWPNGPSGVYTHAQGYQTAEPFRSSIFSRETRFRSPPHTLRREIIMSIMYRIFEAANFCKYWIVQSSSINNNGSKYHVKILNLIFGFRRQTTFVPTTRQNQNVNNRNNFSRRKSFRTK